MQHCLYAPQFCWDEVVQPNNWITILFCVLLFILTMIVVTYRRRLLLVFRALFSQRHFSLIQREGKILESRGSVLLLLFDLLTITLGLVMFCTTYFSGLMSRLPFVAWLGIFLAVLMLAYAVKLLCNEIYSSLFGRDKERASVNLYKFIVMTDFAVLIFPLLLIVQYTGLRFFYYIIAAIVSVLFFVWFYRIMKINSINGHRFHFFLYFCTLEILPWLLMFKTLLII